MYILLLIRTNFLWKLSLARIRFFIKPFIQGGSRSSQVILSLGIKFETIFSVVELKRNLIISIIRKLFRDKWQWISLKVFHGYYYQVQMQLAVYGYSWCDIFLPTIKESFRKRIYVYKSFWLIYKHKAEIFYS